MVVKLSDDERGEAQFLGLRMAADEFLSLPDDGFNYELLDGVVVMSPNPTPPHQRVAGEIFSQIKWYLRDHPVGEVFFEIDVHLGRGARGGDLVYRPEVIFVSAARLPEMTEKISGAPELVVEVISRGSRRLDTQTKRGDYERSGVEEYWLVDPQRRALTFLRRAGGKFVEAQPDGDTLASSAIAGFELDLKPVRAAFEPW